MKKKQPFFSIIVPIYNVEAYLNDCLNSILKQSFKNFEVLCIDDGSTDGSKILAQEFEKKDCRFKLFCKKNGGVSAARNLGLENAKGKYALFVDADDFIDRKMLKILYKKICETGADIVVFGGDTFPKVEWIDKKMETRSVEYNNRSVTALINEVGSIPFICNKVYSLEIIRKRNLRFDERLELGEDQLFQFTVFPFAKKISFIPEKLYHYRQNRDGSAMQSYSLNLEKKIHQHIMQCKYILEYWMSSLFSNADRRTLLDWCVEFLYNDLLALPFDILKSNTLSFIDFVKKSEYETDDIMSNERYVHLKKIAEWDMTPKISVVMPVYNCEKYLHESINSIVKQSFFEFELICVDDGSTDHSTEIIKRIKHNDNRVRLIEKRHTGAAEARNLALKKANGKFVIFLDSDDFFEANLLEKAYKRIETENADICVFKGKSFDDLTGEIRFLDWTCNTQLINEKTFNRKENSKNIFCFTTPAPWTKMFRRDFLLEEKIQFQNIRNSNDIVFTILSLATAKRITTLNDYLVFYRVNIKSLQSTKDGCPLEFTKALRELKRELIERGIYDEIKQQYICFALDCCIYNLSTLKTRAAFEQVYFYLKDSFFHDLEISKRKENYFYGYNEDNYEKMKDILRLPILEYVNKYDLFMNKPVNDMAQKSREEKLPDNHSYVQRKIYGLISCVYDHGIIYTFILGCKKIKKLLMF